MLPADLHAAEGQAQQALLAALTAEPKGRWTVDWRFQGLRLLPVVLRLAAFLRDQGLAPKLLFPDAGACALAKRDGPDLADCMADFRGHRLVQSDGPTAGLLVAVAPGQPDYSDFEQVCGQHLGSVVVVNGALEDAAVGIGSVARERRRGFLSQWQAAYSLLPLDGRALRRAFPGEWELYRQDPDGYRLVESFKQKPDAEEQALALAGGEPLGIGANLKMVDSLIEGLRR
ncbi:DUF1995 family protein [Cyanobium sp. WAJ14-Wanaka]|uniref:DUF1995 family protein n=1 Tax=Cyanobium sp. WAJ14-Wanaka TaxID=2823725 RepID=UPI0020CE7676|nr:DUF1995 family protein [Cyanobium sp. WAJ14-Wanaka]MCP9774525.1 DUF1995 family protein [Cyanobium sp. WAJ14-Wanaka]